MALLARLAVLPPPLAQRAAVAAPVEAGEHQDLAQAMAREALAEELSTRKMEALRLPVGGASSKAIAAQLNLSENTVKSHLGHIFRKLNAQGVAVAVSAALQGGLVPMTCCVLRVACCVPVLTRITQHVSR